jgi:hypothetical protein
MRTENIGAKLEELRELVYGEDISGPTVPEYIEHHESIQKILTALDGILETVPEKKGIDNFDIFEDRVLSILTRWRKFKTDNPDKVSKSIEMFLSEINDEFTRRLMG